MTAANNHAPVSTLLTRQLSEPLRCLCCLPVLLCFAAAAMAEDIPDNACPPVSAFHRLTIDEPLHPSLLPEPGLDRYQYEENIHRLENRGGAYAYPIARELIGLGRVLSEQQHVEEAAAAFQRALHIVRVNHGLNSLRQVPVMELVIESFGAIGEWEVVANVYEQMRIVYESNYSGHDPRLLPVLKRLRKWHLQAYSKETGRMLYEHFNAAERIYDQALAITGKCVNDQRTALCFWHRACCPDANPDYGTCPLDRE